MAFRHAIDFHHECHCPPLAVKPTNLSTLLCYFKDASSSSFSRTAAALQRRAPKRNIWRAQGIDCHSQSLQRKRLLDGGDDDDE